MTKVESLLEHNENGKGQMAGLPGLWLLYGGLGRYADRLRHMQEPAEPLLTPGASGQRGLSCLQDVLECFVPLVGRVGLLRELRWASRFKKITQVIVCISSGH